MVKRGVRVKSRRGRNSFFLLFFFTFLFLLQSFGRQISISTSEKKIYIRKLILFVFIINVYIYNIHYIISGKYCTTTIIYKIND